jgi:hypothetical protein
MGWPGFGMVVGSCEYGNEPSFSTKDEESLDQLGDYQVLKKDSEPVLGRLQVDRYLPPPSNFRKNIKIKNKNKIRVYQILVPQYLRNSSWRHPCLVQRQL